ncbi:MAG: hypothetical protein JWR27_712 [Aeromicrobium sp.]|nr:hypothetical protein [Aeromicrobium sp.]
MRLTNPLWYLVAFLLAVGSAMVAAAVAATAYDTIKTTRVTGLQELADARGKTLAVYTDDYEPERAVTCHAVDRDKVRVEVDKAVPDIDNRTGGTTWHLLAVLEDGRDGLQVTCSPKSKDIDDGAAYAWSVVDDYEAPSRNGKGIASLGLAAGAGFGAYVFWCRRTARREARLEAATRKGI